MFVRLARCLTGLLAGLVVIVGFVTAPTASAATVGVAMTGPLGSSMVLDCGGAGTFVDGDARDGSIINATLTNGGNTVTLTGLHATSNYPWTTQVDFKVALIDGPITVATTGVTFTGTVMGCSPVPPADTDGDGFADSVDACPTAYSTVNGGCPVTPPVTQHASCKANHKVINALRAKIDAWRAAHRPVQGLEQALRVHQRQADKRGCK